MGEVIEAGVLEGVASTTVKKLHKAGLVTLESIAVTPPRDIAERAGMGIDTAIKVNALARLKVDPGFVSASDMLEMRKHKLRCRTGSDVLNRILGGGLETGADTDMATSGQVGTFYRAWCKASGRSNDRDAFKGNAQAFTTFINETLGSPPDTRARAWKDYTLGEVRKLMKAAEDLGAQKGSR